MTAQHYRRLFAYDQWANDSLLEFAGRLSDEQFRQPSDYSIGSVHEQLVHLVGVEWVFLKRVQGVSPEALPETVDFPTLESIRQKWEAVRAGWQTYLAALSDDMLDETIHFTGLKPPQPRTSPLWEMLAHMLNHSTDHRAQTLAQIHKVGGETFAQDLMAYAWLFPSVD